MMRLVLLTLLICAFSLGCMAQTFQYSRGWTNGKRSLGLPKAQPQQHEHQRYITMDGSQIDPELFEENMERYFLELPRFMRNTLLARSIRRASTGGLSNIGLDGGNNNLFGAHRQSNELFDEINGVGVVEPNDFPKH